jgi:hypothetical protein
MESEVRQHLGTCLVSYTPKTAVQENIKMVNVKLPRGRRRPKKHWVAAGDAIPARRGAIRCDC